MNNIYANLSGIRLLAQSYTFKFLFVAFLGIHIPLIGIIALVIYKPDHLTPLYVFVAVLVLTLLATALTLYVLNGLLDPLKKSKTSLENYLHNRTLPSLPMIYTDEAGILMHDIQVTLTELDNLLEEKKDLTGFISHDLRMPMLNVKTFSNELMGEGFTDIIQVKKIALKIWEATDEQERLLVKILELLEQDDLFATSTQLKMGNINPVIQTAINEMKILADKKNITLHFKPEKDINANISQHMFKQVMNNLIANAVKFSYQGSTVSIAAVEEEGKVQVIIKDEGMGFNEYMSALLFRRFTRGKKGTAGEPSTGMGLYISRRIIEFHQGVISASSPGEGKGSVFTIQLPRS